MFKTLFSNYFLSTRIEEFNEKMSFKILKHIINLKADVRIYKQEENKTKVIWP